MEEEKLNKTGCHSNLDNMFVSNRTSYNQVRSASEKVLKS
jgi:hypothetical protein